MRLAASGPGRAFQGPVAASMHSAVTPRDPSAPLLSIREVR